MGRRGGPTPYVCVPFDRKLREGEAVFELRQDGLTFAQIAERLGMSETTAWRRCWFLWDFSNARLFSGKAAPLPPQRGTAACPRGNPCNPGLHHPKLPFPRFCTRPRKNGGECGNHPIRGGVVCREHGGADPAVRARADEMLERARQVRRLEVANHWANHR